MLSGSGRVAEVGSGGIATALFVLSAFVTPLIAANLTSALPLSALAMLGAAIGTRTSGALGSTLAVLCGGTPRLY